ncbi:MAG: hypothetical protein JXA30_05140 [Deltaproteobacteria bacterium]|nr:hypothetical protein [Deltaproteobacteria bacterium]
MLRGFLLSTTTGATIIKWIIYEFMQRSAISRALAYAPAVAVSWMVACGSGESEPNATSSGVPPSAGGGGVRVVHDTGSAAGEAGPQTVIRTKSDAGVATGVQSGTGGGAADAGIETSMIGDADSDGAAAGGALAGGGASGASAAGSTQAGGVGGSIDLAGTGGIAEDECGPIPTSRQEAATPKAVVLYALAGAECVRA